MAQSVLGGSLRVRGIYENMDVDIPAGTGSHKIIKLSNKGKRKRIKPDFKLGLPVTIVVSKALRFPY